jgi:hypothetical protein
VAEVVAGTVAQVVVVLLLVLVAVGELALQLFAAFGALVGLLQVLAGAVVAAQDLVVAAGVAGLAAAVGALLAPGEAPGYWLVAFPCAADLAERAVRAGSGGCTT